MLLTANQPLLGGGISKAEQARECLRESDVSVYSADVSGLFSASSGIRCSIVSSWLRSTMTHKSCVTRSNHFVRQVPTAAYKIFGCLFWIELRCVRGGSLVAAPF
jgi:hypothetical protein